MVSNSVYILVVGVVALAFAFFAGYTMLNDPTDPMRDKLADVLTDIQPPTADYDPFVQSDYGGVQEAIEARPALWQELIPPPPKPKPKPKPPNLKAMLKGVMAPPRDQVGDRIRIRLDPRDVPGGFYGVGDQIRGLTIKSFNDDVVEFMLEEKDNEYTYELQRDGRPVAGGD